MHTVTFNIHFVYSSIKSLIEYNGQSSESFPCIIGLRLGWNMLPFFFSIYLNDVDALLLCRELSCISEEGSWRKELNIYI
jgi:hypothetical protein